MRLVVKQPKRSIHGKEHHEGNRHATAQLKTSQHSSQLAVAENIKGLASILLAYGPAVAYRGSPQRLLNHVGHRHRQVLARHGDILMQQSKNISELGYDIAMMPRSELEEKAKKLTWKQRNVAVDAGTEAAFTGRTTNGYAHDNKIPGYYVGAISGVPLFSSDEKYDSGTGWPSFGSPVDKQHVICRPDPKDEKNPLARFLMGGVRTEVIDAVSGAHLGHVFADGPPPTGLRYCLNAAALTFVPTTDGKVPRGNSIDEASL